jgi:exonuclease III
LTHRQLTNTITRIQHLIADLDPASRPATLEEKVRDTVNNDAFQGMLFGTTSAEDAITEDGPADELRLCALNVNSPNSNRAQRIVDWLLATKSNILVLTEMQPSEGGRHILACLQAERFTTTYTPGWTDSRYLAAISHPALCVVGDLNVVEPNHQPRLPAFEEHDYAFYTGLLTLGLRDAYRELNPTGGDHSWINPRFGSQRLDHTLVSVAAGEIRTCAYDHTTRADKLSDHAALLTTIGLRPDGAVAAC